MTADYPLEDLASLPSFYHPAASPDGEQIAVYYDISGRNELFLIDTDTGDRTQISDGNVPCDATYPFRWAPSGDRLYFHQDQEGNEQNDILAIDRDGTVEPLVENDSQCVLTDVSADGEQLLFLSDVGQQLNLYHYDREADSTAQLTTYDQPVEEGLYSPDADRIAYVTNESENLENRDIYIADADGSNPRKLEIGEIGAEAEIHDWHPDGTRLLVEDNSTDKPRCGVYVLARDTVEWYTATEHVESPTAFLPDGSGFLATRTQDCAIRPLLYNIESGTSKPFDLPDGVASFPYYGDTAILGESEVLIKHQTPTKRPALQVYNFESGTVRTVIEPEYGDIDPGGFVDCSYDSFRSHDGLDIEALVYDSGERPSPAVVKVHGGPPSQDLQAFDLYAQFLATRGYSVLQVNYRGSTGRGREFKNRINKDWGGAEQGDIAEGTRWLSGKDWIDEDRIAVFGGSYGGYSAYLQMLQYPDLYAAGIAWIGMTDLPALYEESMPHFQTTLEKYLGDPESNEAFYRERSPIKHVENLGAPLCIIHGVNDPRCPISQARSFRDALKEAGYNQGEDGHFEYNELGEEGHGSTDIDQKIRAFRIMGDFLERRLS